LSDVFKAAVCHPTPHCARPGADGARRRACMDVVLAGLGWVAVTGHGEVKIRVLAPDGVGVMQREPLMPFEARTSTESYTGGGDKRGTSRRTKSLKAPKQPRW
jgi:hypothetical protein